MIGFLAKQGSEYTLTPDSAAFLNRRSPAYLGTMAKFLMSSACRRNVRGHDGRHPARRSVAERSRRSGTRESHVGGVRALHGADDADAGGIDRENVRRDSSPIKVLDISAGHGLYGIAFAKHNPNAKIVGLDWANVLEVAKENAAKAGVADRYSTIPGSAFDVDFGSGYNIVLIPNFLHHFDPATNEKLLRKVHAALAPEGIAITPEFIPERRSRVSAARRDV